MKSPLIFMDPFPRTESMLYTPDCAARLRRLGTVIAHWGSRAPDSLVEACLPEMTVLVGQTPMPAERLERAGKLRAIINVKGNWEPTVDYARAQSRNIYVLSIAPAMAPAVAEFCLGQAISLLRGLNNADAVFRQGHENYGIEGNREAKTLFRANVSLLGYGNLGRALVPLLRPFDVRLTVHDPWLPDGYLRAEGVEPAELDTALSRADILFILAGVTLENQGFLDRDKLSLIPPDASVVLASRAEIVNFDDFVDLAASGAFRAAVDVFPREPVPANTVWRTSPNVVFSAHLAGGIAASYARIREMLLDDIGQILKGLPPSRLQRADPEIAARMRSR